MATLQPGDATISEPLTWAQIRARYPDEWVCLVEIGWLNDTDLDFTTARVAGHRQDAPRATGSSSTVADSIRRDRSLLHWQDRRAQPPPVSVKTTRFEAASDLIIVGARVWGPATRGQTPLSLAIDTGSAETVIRPDVVDDLGYSPRDAEAITTVRAAIGKEHGYTLRVARFSALGFTIPDFPIHIFDLVPGFGIDGLVGLSFLRQFNYTVRSAEGRILVERVV